eukprot:scaffold140_cov247-Pinguiococcus_pyrenoidosus.AAC.31
MRIPHEASRRRLALLAALACTATSFAAVPAASKDDGSCENPAFTPVTVVTPFTVIEDAHRVLHPCTVVEMAARPCPHCLTLRIADIGRGRQVRAGLLHKASGLWTHAGGLYRL